MQKEHWGKGPERPDAWLAIEPTPVLSDRATSERRVSWQALRRRARVISADGKRVGAVEHVLADVRLDIFAAS